MGRFTVATKYWHRTEDGRVQCDVCPLACRLREGQRGLAGVFDGPPGTWGSRRLPVRLG